MNNHEEAGCQAPPAGPILCIQNCGFFGSASNMNMCSKCHKDLIMNQEKAGVAATSTENNVNSIPREHVVAPNSPDLKTIFFNSKFSFKTNYDVSDPLPSTFTFGSGQNSGEAKQPPEVPQRCSSCNKRVGLTGFNCRCGHLFCALHRLSEKHDCSYEYRTAGRYAIAKANPVVKAEKLNKI